MSCYNGSNFKQMNNIKYEGIYKTLKVFATWISAKARRLIVLKFHTNYFFMESKGEGYDNRYILVFLRWFFVEQ